MVHRQQFAHFSGVDVAKEFAQIEWDAFVEDDCRQIVRLAIREDLSRKFDWTTVALVPSGTPGRAAIVARSFGVACGMRAVALALTEMDAALQLAPDVEDGARIAPGQSLGVLVGPARSLLTAERTLLNIVQRLSGIASLTRRYVDAVAGTRARIYDTRKTTPGWRRMEKYAVRCGGGHNHRLGLYDAILIKDNHLALGATSDRHLTPADAVKLARELVHAMASSQAADEMIVEVEVDTLDQLQAVLPTGPDIVLLDNMPPEVLRRAVALRNELAPGVELEASGGIHLDNVAAVAATGVERISIGALTHSAPALDVGLDWR